MNSVAQKVEDLVVTSGNVGRATGERVVESFEKSTRPLMLWLHFLQTNHMTGVADCLLIGSRSAVNEAAACLSIGLVRPALNSIRLQIDLLLGWQYFKDHKMEWARLGESGDGYRLKSEIIRYLGEVVPKFGTRFALLKDCKKRQVDEPYRLLSAHVHGQSEFVIPIVQEPKDIVSSKRLQDDLVLVQGECVEYIGDIFWSIYADRWAALHPELKQQLLERFDTPKQKNAFFAQ